ncbi:hypothetical protein EK21DRAFT_82747 [Setomelanomma holmii]|uniref:C2H2-type domain-containing protein n=1 Tax=Setomelanomma holmii TaxID=210430 RepID=A0A9P4GWC5_9PLEO|nr:hypothetical protein EK21DRAFT_82747 [Setomelanomma holmii]
MSPFDWASQSPPFVAPATELQSSPRSSITELGQSTDAGSDCKSYNSGSASNSDYEARSPCRTTTSKKAASRLYRCDRGTNDLSGDGQCTASFNRPEHLRRHVKTLHGEGKVYCCKVPSCERAFSRLDNFQDHYWTHVEKGGRAGKNKKLSFSILKDILGPNEKVLVGKLRKRLIEDRRRKAAMVKSRSTPRSRGGQLLWL